MSSIEHDIADGLKAALEAVPAEDWLMAFAVKVDEMPEYQKKDLQAKPIVSIIPRGSKRTKIGRGAWKGAPEIGVIIQYAMPERKEKTPELREAADLADRRLLTEFVNQIERVMANATILSRNVEELTQANGAFYFSHLKDKRIYSRFLAATYTGQLV